MHNNQPFMNSHTFFHSPLTLFSTVTLYIFSALICYEHMRLVLKCSYITAYNLHIAMHCFIETNPTYPLLSWVNVLGSSFLIEWKLRYFTSVEKLNAWLDASLVILPKT